MDELCLYKDLECEYMMEINPCVRIFTRIKNHFNVFWTHVQLENELYVIYDICNGHITF